MILHYYDKHTGKYRHSNMAHHNGTKPLYATFLEPDPTFENPTMNSLTGQWFDADNPPDEVELSSLFDLFTADELGDILESTNKHVKVLVMMVTNSGSRVKRTNPKLTGGIAFLASPQGGSILTEARRDEILGALA